MDAVVFGNATLDVLCYPVDDVPRHDSLLFERSAVGPGGCGSNVAVGLARLGIPTALIACIGSDEPAQFVRSLWRRAGVDERFVTRVDRPTAISVGLVDSNAQPRFIHTPNSNAELTVDQVDVDALVTAGARLLHVGGFFVLPGLFDGRLPSLLARAQSEGLLTSLDVALSSTMADPQPLWDCMDHLDIFLSNLPEAERLTGESDPAVAARSLRARGAAAAIVKLGAEGCWAEGADFSGRIPASDVAVVDTTGAGDAFAAGLLAALLAGEDLPAACRAGNAAGARIVQRLGTVAAWFAGEG